MFARTPTREVVGLRGACHRRNGRIDRRVMPRLAQCGQARRVGTDMPVTETDHVEDSNAIHSQYR